MNKELLAYAMDFVSFFTEEFPEDSIKKVKDIILFGSVARRSADKNSDIDIFINVTNAENLESKIEKIKSDFYKTEVFKRWKLKGVENEIKIIADRLDKWKDLKISIISDGIILYSKYTGASKGAQQVILYWDGVKDQSKRVLLSKKLYGYTQGKFKYKGMVELTGSEKLGSNCILSSLQDSKKFIDIFNEMKINVKRIYVSRI